MMVELRALARADAADVARWMARPHVWPWLMQPANVLHIVALIDADGQRGFVVAVGDRPVGFIRAWNCYDQPDDVRDGMRPPTTWGFEMLIGEADCLRRGIASAALRCLIARLEREVRCARLVVELASDNEAGIGLLERAGFQVVATIDDLPRPMHLMARWTDTSSVSEAPKSQP